MATYDAIVTVISSVQVEADSEEQAIEKIKASFPPRTIVNVAIPQEAKIIEEK